MTERLAGWWRRSWRGILLGASLAFAYGLGTRHGMRMATDRCVQSLNTITDLIRARIPRR